MLAMFYNNKSADALIKENYSQAYAYFRSALTIDPIFTAVWTNFGSLYRRTGHIKLAEKGYLKALSINKIDSTTLDNLAYIYSVTGREDKAANIRKKILARRMDNPFYYFMPGEVASDEQDWKQAIGLNKNNIIFTLLSLEFILKVAMWNKSRIMIYLYLQYIKM